VIPRKSKVMINMVNAFDGSGGFGGGIIWNE
jgi:hypothetical protein